MRIFNICTLTHTVVLTKETAFAFQNFLFWRVTGKSWRRILARNICPFVLPPRFLGHYFHVNLWSWRWKRNLFLLTFPQLRIIIFFWSHVWDCSSVLTGEWFQKGQAEKWYPALSRSAGGVVSLYVVRNSQYWWRSQYCNLPCPVTTWLLRGSENIYMHSKTLTWLLPWEGRAKSTLIWMTGPRSFTIQALGKKGKKG